MKGGLNIMKFDNRPWGKWEILDECEGYWVKKIIVKPNQKLSLQYHYHRDEDWQLIEGYGIITLDNERILVSKGYKIHIPKFATHRIENTGEEDLIFIEIATGNPNEEDIVRIEDAYGRE